MPVQIDQAISNVSWEPEVAGPAPESGSQDDRTQRLMLADIRRDRLRTSAEDFDD